MQIFTQATMPALRRKSLLLTGYLEQLLNSIPDKPYRLMTPSDPEQRGCQLSIIAPVKSKTLQQKLHAQGIICDYREPNVLRVAPVPMYNSFQDVWKLGVAMRETVA